MTLRTIRELYRINRYEIEMLNNLSPMELRTIENKKVIDITILDLDIFATGLGIEIDDMIRMVTGLDITLDKLKGGFFERTAKGKINVQKTHKSLDGCSNNCTLPTFIKYMKSKNAFDYMKLNWCIYKALGREIDENID